MKKVIGTRCQFQPCDELKYAGEMCEITKNEGLEGGFDYQVKFDDGHMENVYAEELG